MFSKIWITTGFSQAGLSYYLPSGVTYDDRIPAPKDIIGHEVGEWHVTHDQLVYYMQELAKSSDRVTMTEIGRSYENRPLQLLIITSPENQSRIDEIRRQHLSLTDPDVSASLDLSSMPVVVFMGYSVHGNEASGANAALLVAYHLAAARGAQIEDKLENAVVLIHPAINPDGLNRFASWVNTHRSRNIISDPNDREHDEAWPGGRTNHYWFDLNRDWLPVQLKESRARMTTYHRWKPNVLTDHHEMGTNSTFFFQPGIPSRNFPLTPPNTYTLTRKIAAFHARALDRIGSLYYTEESYDDFYIGKGSAYPDVNGGVGILFEQASSRGHAQESENGRLDFPFAIRNQFTTSLSTLEASVALRVDLLEHQRRFYQEAMEMADEHPVKAYVFGSEDKARTWHMTELLDIHQIDYYNLSRTIQATDKQFEPGDSYIIPLSQPQHRLIRAIFEKQTNFSDSLFYDVSTWTLPLAFGLEYTELDGRQYNASLQGQKAEALPFPSGMVSGESSYAYVFDWTPFYAPAAVNHLLENGIRLKVSSKPFNAANRSFSYGTIMVPVAQQPNTAKQLHALWAEVAEKYGVDVVALSTGLNAGSIDIGSPSFDVVRKPEVMLLVGEGISSYEAGEIWHLTDQRMNMQVSKVTIPTFNRADLDKYNTLLMVNGSYNSLDTDKLKRWLQEGGVIVATKGATRWLSRVGLSRAKFKNSSPDTTGVRAYEKISEYRGAQQLGGSIFNTTLDLSHPLCYGYTQPELPVFKNSRIFMERATNPYANPVKYTEEPLLSGYVSKQNLELIKGSAVASTSAYGRGRIILITDNPNFRAFWLGTTKIFLNGIFFGNQISSRATE